jgi:anthranilate synthase component 1
MPSLAADEFDAVVAAERRAHPGRELAVPLSLRLLADQLTPVLAYRRLVAPDERTAPSFLLESVEGGERQGRYSILGAHPRLELVAFGHEVRVTDRRNTSPPESRREDDPLAVLRDLTRDVVLVHPPKAPGATRLPSCMLGGWVGFAGYDTVRYAEPDKLADTPTDDRGLPDMHFGLYDSVVVFDHVDKLVHLVRLARVTPDTDPDRAYRDTVERLHRDAADIQRHSKPLPSGLVGRDAPSPPPLPSNITPARHAEMVARAKGYIREGDIFQVVLGQRFERRSTADPFDVYRALRAVNPSPYMVYLQTHGCILVASSPEILCRVRAENGRRIVTNRPLAGTRRRGRTPDEDAALERDLLADPKERAEHVMLLDLGRNDAGKVCEPGTIRLPRIMEVERYSHVMHISSTVTGELRHGLDCWDALRAALPAGTVSGAPKVRAMQVIDELEPVKRGPYGGGIGYVALDGDMDIALALRTMVVPTALRTPSGWVYHLQAAGGIVADSDPDAEYQETVNKAAALARAISLAEQAFAEPPTPPPR